MPLGETSIRGKAGRLLWGRRVVTEFKDWSGGLEPDGSWRINVTRHEPDPLLWEHHGDTLFVEIDAGPAPWEFRAEILSENPLVLRLEQLE